ncbi:MAG: hypothetical protein IJ233_04095, partial [Pyramidobacter sp.]|nr:hypothetical protein [Pyramidobacter sp.]
QDAGHEFAIDRIGPFPQPFCHDPHAHHAPFVRDCTIPVPGANMSTKYCVDRARGATYNNREI